MIRGTVLPLAHSEPPTTTDLVNGHRRDLSAAERYADLMEALARRVVAQAASKSGWSAR